MVRAAIRPHPPATAAKKLLRSTKEDFFETMAGLRMADGHGGGTCFGTGFPFHMLVNGR